MPIIGNFHLGARFRYQVSQRGRAVQNSPVGSLGIKPRCDINAAAHSGMGQGYTKCFFSQSSKLNELIFIARCYAEYCYGKLSVCLSVRDVEVS